MDIYIYDIEDYPNLFMVSFISLDCPQPFINAYIEADKKGNAEDKRKLLVAMKVRTFTIFKGYHEDKYVKDDIVLLKDFMIHHKVLYGFNSTNYDSLMMDILLHHYKYFFKNGCNSDGVHITTFLFDYSDKIVNYGKGFRWTLDFYKFYKRPYTDRDIQKILYLDKSFTGLKKVAINLRWYRIQELPIPVGTIIKSNDIERVKDYNINDILITLELVRNQKEELAIRDSGSEEFEIDLRNMSRSSIGKNLMSKYYSEITNIPHSDFKDTKTDRYKIYVSDIIDPKISFKTPEFNKLFNDIKNSVINITSDTAKNKWGFALLYKGTKYIVAKGGLHSKDDSRIYVCGNHELMRDADVASFYPKIVLNLRISPKHLESYAFLTIMDYLMTARLKAKHAGQKSKADIYKIVINRIYGAFKDTFDYLYDPMCTYKTTVNGQLYLLMLVEELELNNIHVISANTDGIVCKFNNLLEPTYNRVCQEWQAKLDFELEFTDYEKYIRNDVNNYIAIKSGFSKAIKSKESRKDIEKKYIKYKGLFISNPDFSKGFINPVVSKALCNYYIYGTSILETFEDQLKSKDGIYDFCITQKIDKKFEAQYHHVEFGARVIDILQQYNRFYISKESCGILLKHDPVKKRNTSIVAKQNTRILNTYRGEPISDVKFSYYGAECSKIMDGGTKKNSFGISTLSLDLEFDYSYDSVEEELESYYDDYSYLYYDD